MIFEDYRQTYMHLDKELHFLNFQDYLQLPQQQVDLQSYIRHLME